MKVDLDALAPAERRLLLVASDETYRRLTERIDWAALAKTAAFRMLTAATPVVHLLPYVSATIGESLARTGYLAPTWTRVADEIAKLRRPPLRVGELPIPHASPADAARLFRFDQALPIDGAAYVLDPIRGERYLPMASANERIAQEKVGAFLRLSSALGASEVEVTSGESVTRVGDARARSPLPDAAGQLGLHVAFDARGQVDRSIVARFDQKVAPHVPDDLHPWLAQDPILDAMARTRLDGGLREQACTLSFHDAIDVGAGACAELEGKGIDVGGKYRAVRASRWSFVVRFYP